MLAHFLIYYSSRLLPRSKSEFFFVPLFAVSRFTVSSSSHALHCVAGARAQLRHCDLLAMANEDSPKAAALPPYPEVNLFFLEFICFGAVPA